MFICLFVLFFLVDRYRAFNGSCREAAISHFQGWKRNYLMATTRAAPADTHALILSEFGFIPYRIPNPAHHIQTMGDLVTPELSVMGRVNVQQIQEISLKLSLSGYLHRENGRGDTSSDDISTAYCGAFSTELNKCTCPLLSKDIRVVYVAANYNQNENAVTFITAAWADDFYSGALDDTLNAWSAGQKVSFVV